MAFNYLFARYGLVPRSFVHYVSRTGSLETHPLLWLVENALLLSKLGHAQFSYDEFVVLILNFWEGTTERVRNVCRFVPIIPMSTPRRCCMYLFQAVSNRTILDAFVVLSHLLSRHLLSH